jgi:ribosome-binding protein aMBF1 (putative translation factor)
MINKNKIKLYNLSQVFGKVSKTKFFRQAYNEESSRIRLAKSIREARTSKRLTQEELAQKANMSQSVIARLESGNHGVSLDTLSRVANVVGKKVELT